MTVLLSCGVYTYICIARVFRECLALMQASVSLMQARACRHAVLLYCIAVYSVTVMQYIGVTVLQYTVLQYTAVLLYCSIQCYCIAVYRLPHAGVCLHDCVTVLQYIFLYITV